MSGSGDSDSGSGGGSASGGCDGGGSTPFLQRIGIDGEIITLNDIMVTYPSSMFAKQKDGAQALARGDIGSDVYPVSIRDLTDKDRLNFRLKEIEYETSTIAAFSYAGINLADSDEIATDHTHAQTLVISKIRNITDFDKSFVANKIFRSNTTSELQTVNCQPIADSLYLNHGDDITFSVTKNNTGATYLAVAAFFHDLHTGGAEEYIDELKPKHVSNVKSPYHKSIFLRNIPLVGSLSVLLAMILPNSAAPNDQSLIKLSNFIPHAHADTPHKSLYFYYMNTEGAWTHFCTMHPRFKLSHKVTALLPDEAFECGRTDVEVKVVSNSKHFIYSIGMVDQVEIVTPGSFTPVVGLVNGSVEHEFARGKALVTLPGDKFEFSVTTSDDKVTHILFKIQGHYSPLVCKTEAEGKKWWSDLSLDEQAMMSAPSNHGV